MLRKVISRLLSKIYAVRYGITCSGPVKIRGAPQILIHPEASVVFGREVTLHSKPLKYHAFMHSPTKILADRPGAKIRIGDGTRINGACIHAVSSIEIGARCLLAAGVQVIDSNGHSASMDDPSTRLHSVDEGRPVVIEDDVWLGLNVIVLPGAVIGAGSIVGAGVVVSGVIPPRSIIRTARPEVLTRGENGKP